MHSSMQRFDIKISPPQMVICILNAIQIKNSKRILLTDKLILQFKYKSKFI